MASTKLDFKDLYREVMIVSGGQELIVEVEGDTPSKYVQIYAGGPFLDLSDDQVDDLINALQQGKKLANQWRNKKSE